MKFFKKSPYFQNKTSELGEQQPKHDNNTKYSNKPKPLNFSLRNQPNASKLPSNTSPKPAESSKNVVKNKKLYVLEHNDEYDETHFIEPTETTWSEIENNQLMLIETFNFNNWDEKQVESFMMMQTCSNCDNDGHILENCPKLFEENKFKLQCLTCHKPNVSSDCCETCQKN